MLAHLSFIRDRAGDASRRTLQAAVGLAVQPASPSSDRAQLGAELARELGRRVEEVPLALFGMPLLAMARAGVDEAALRGDLIAMAAAGAAGAERTDLEGVLPYREFAQNLAHVGQTAVARDLLEARLRSGAEFSTDARALLASLIFIAHAGARDPIERTIALLDEFEQAGALATIPAFGEQAQRGGALLVLAQMHSLVGDDEGSEALLVLALRASGESDGMVANNLGYLRLERDGPTPDVVRLIELAARLEPDETNVLDSLGWLRFQQGQIEDMESVEGARAIFERAWETLASNPDGPSPELMHHYAEVIWAGGDHRRARTILADACAELRDGAHRPETIAAIGRAQARGWGLIVVDPEVAYQRMYGALLDRMTARLAEMDQELAAAADAPAALNNQPEGGDS